MIKIYIFVFCFIVHISSLFSQNNSEQHICQTLHSKYTNEKKIAYDDILGSPYRFEKFNEGEVTFSMNNIPVKYKLNYNAYTDALEYLKDNKTYTVTNPQEIKKVFLNNEVILYFKYYNDGSVSKGYFIELIDSQISLYKRETVIYLPTKGYSFQISKNNSGEFVRLKTKYYISILGCPAFLVKNKKNIISEFSSNPVVIDYLKKEGIDVHSEDDLKKFAEYINHYRTR